MPAMTKNELKEKLREIASSCSDFAPSEFPAQGSPTIYLTFDDGPGPYTADLLDVLKDCGVHATFFVTGRLPEHQAIISRACAEGHSIGAHSLSHDYSKVYASSEAFYRDFLACEEMIRVHTGRYTPLFRFPGGSSNTVSHITPGIMTHLAKTMPDLGFRYFDWNVDSGDASKTISRETILSTITESCRGQKVNLVLQHDVNALSVGIVRDVIIWGKDNGYLFLPLGTESPAAKHHIAN